MNHYKDFFRITFTLTIMTALMSISSQVFAQEGARVYLQPVDSVDGLLTVEVIVENVTDMYGAEFRLKYDPAVVSVQDANPDQAGIQIEAGSLLPANQGFVVANKVNEAEGSVVFALTLLNPAPPVTGSGALARVTFNVLQNAPSSIDIEKAKLVAVDLQTIPSQAVPLAIGNSGGQQQPQQQQQQQPQPQHPETMAPTNIDTPAAAAIDGPDFPWWIVAAGIMILGILGLGALIVLSGLSKSQKNSQTQPKRQLQSRQTQATPQKPNQQQHPRHVPGTRPSAFK